ncbi:MAG: WGR domain-containing protein [Polyangiaceae bacterium]
MAHVKSWKVGETGSPKFAGEYEILQHTVLQVTDIKTNHNKYYALELHAAKGALGSYPYRLFTHYGRTDDLENNPEAGQRECRFFTTLVEAQAEYRSIFSEKTSPRKGYKEVSLAATKIGSTKALGTSSGEIDSQTLAKINTPSAPKVSTLSSGMQRFVSYIYREATDALTTTVNAKITANGIETPLGVLTLGQIEKGENILQEMYDLFQAKKATRSKMMDLSSAFYTVIPHRIGRSAAAIESSVINSMDAFSQKQETLQLMKDMLHVNGDGSVLYNTDVDAKFAALSCDVKLLEPGCPEFEQIKRYFLDSRIKKVPMTVRNVFTLRRPGEYERFTNEIDNQRLLFHGSRIRNWVGLLSRGLVLPKIAVSMGVSRTDGGWLGNGIYFGDTSCTAAYYTSPGREGTAFMAINRVALGKMKDYTRITYGLNSPPAGYQSNHGVRARTGVISDFADDEYVIYTPEQQRLEYLVEFSR